MFLSPGAFVILIAAGPGCASRAVITQGTEPRPYPYDSELLEAREVQLFRDGPRITLANHTVETFSDFDLWLNERYVRHVDRLPAGAMLTLRLREFVSEYGEPFKGGGFFGATEPDPIVKAEIETPNGMLGLIPIPERGGELR